MIQKAESATTQMLNKAFELDPAAIYALITNRVPCKEVLSDEAYVVAEEVPCLASGYYQVGALGLINAVMTANNLPLVAAIWDESPEEGEPRLLGFTDYNHP